MVVLARGTVSLCVLKMLQFIMVKFRGKKSPDRYQLSGQAKGSGSSYVNNALAPALLTLSQI
jgi:hypothetical protein